jgi:hypothetical protein
MEEVPGLVAAYKRFKPRGFDVLGISLDQADSAASLASVMKDKGMTWRQVYDGKGWKAAIGQIYLVDSIPRAFLVDGDTGVILAAGNALRGSSLAATIAGALTAKGKN